MTRRTDNVKFIFFSEGKNLYARSRKLSSDSPCEICPKGDEIYEPRVSATVRPRRGRKEVRGLPSSLIDYYGRDVSCQKGSQSGTVDIDVLDVEKPPSETFVSDVG